MILQQVQARRTVVQLSLKTRARSQWFTIADNSILKALQTADGGLSVHAAFGRGINAGDIQDAIEGRRVHFEYYIQYHIMLCYYYNSIKYSV